MDKVQEIMAVVDLYGHSVVALDNAQSNGDIQNALAVADSAHKDIESALRELVERKPLSEERIWEIEAVSNVSSRRPEYTTDCYGDEKTIWHETKAFSFPLFARNIERAHGIGA